MKNFWISIVILGMTMGTAWAVRGQFGHEQGAAWAGAIGAFGLIIVSNRKDWLQKLFVTALASAIGWGVGGMISYGVVVGYGRSESLPNAFYGLLMLFVIGGLYGMLGGGLTGLSLESSAKRRVNWGSLIAEMVAGGLLSYGFLIMQLGIKMTPPRSEAWAFCLGAGLAMIWYMARNKFNSSLRLAIYTTLGAGFGFAFGNFLQVLGNVLEIQFNMWNVMEYSIGFFGGSSLAYGVFTSTWPDTSNEPLEAWKHKTSLLIVVALIPLIVFKESLLFNTLLNRLSTIASSEIIALWSSMVSLCTIVAVIVIIWYMAAKSSFILDKNRAWLVFLLYLVLYVVVSFIVSGLFAGVVHLNHWLYVVNLVVILPVLRKSISPFNYGGRFSVTLLNGWPYYLAVVVILIFLFALLLTNIHGEMSGAHNRF
ncbi:hypothetical protein OU798_22880 [Prolixibacteraceae bacterium Z1-6]|uniref:Uncharacterized protein n=1 Tax=Draconibacterium aestuarii TaxID=2998507 RepID=A0A9X3FBE0_9BACT|nr:hypothetical protein [Prolixibacteraceae bacterium Z1-6]